MSIYLVEIDGWDPSLGGVDTLFFGTHAYTSRPTDTPANTRFLPRVITALNLEQSMFSQGTTGGASEVGVGAVELSNLDGALDYLLDWGFVGRIIRIYAIASADDALADATLVFRGTIEQPEFSLERVTFRVRDRLADLDKPVCTARLRGDNAAALTPIGIEGNALDSDGQLRPVTMGWCRNVTAVSVCPQKLTYQVHDGPVKEIQKVYDSGVELATDVVTSDNFSQLQPWDIYIPTFVPEILVSYDQENSWVEFSASGVFNTHAYLNQCTYVKSGSLYNLKVKYDATVVSAAPRCILNVSLYKSDDSEISQILYNYEESGESHSIDIGFNVTMNHDFDRVAVKVSFDSTSGQISSATGYVTLVSLLPVVTDYPDIAALEASVVPAGSYATCLAEGLIRLGASPAGEVTADVLGGISGPNLVSNGYFDDATDWCADAGWVIHPEYHFAAKSAGNVTPVDLSQNIPIVAGATYQIRIICRVNSETYFKAGVGGAWGPSVDTAGVYMATVTAINTDGLIIRGEPGFGFTVSAIEVRRIFLVGSGPSSWHSPVNLLRILALGYGNLADDDLDEASFAAMLDLNLPLVGHLFMDDSTTVISAMDAVCRDVGLWWSFDPLGILRVGRLEIPTGDPVAEYYIDYETLESGGVERLATGDDDRGVPVYRVNVNYQKNNTVQTSSLSTDAVFAQSSVAGVVSDERRAWLNAEYRTVTAQDAAVQVKYKRAPEMTVETGLEGRVDAQAEAARLLAMYGVRRDRFRIRLPAHLTRGLALGDVVRVTFPRFGLGSGKLFTVIGRTDVLSGDQDTTDLDIWG